jgi:hypothetical protein
VESVAYGQRLAKPAETLPGARDIGTLLQPTSLRAYGPVFQKGLAGQVRRYPFCASGKPYLSKQAKTAKPRRPFPGLYSCGSQWSHVRPFSHRAAQSVGSTVAHPCTAGAQQRGQESGCCAPGTSGVRNRLDGIRVLRSPVAGGCAHGRKQLCCAGQTTKSGQEDSGTQEFGRRAGLGAVVRTNQMIPETLAEHE